MAEIKNTFLKGKMNQDLDSRLLPNGEYREAINLMISRSEGSTVGEFENVLGNTSISSLNGDNAVIIGHYVNETTNKVYLFATNYNNVDGVRSTSADNFIYELNLNTNVKKTLVTGGFLNFNKSFPILGVNLIEDLLFFTDNLNQPRKINIDLANPGNITTPTHYQNEDQISVAKYAPCEPIIVLDRVRFDIKGGAVNNVTVIGVDDVAGIKIGDSVSPYDVIAPSGFPSPSAQWNKANYVIAINPTASSLTLSEPMTAPNGFELLAQRPTMTNKTSELLSNGIKTSLTVDAGPIYSILVDSTNDSPDIIPKPGDIIIDTANPSTILSNTTILTANASYASATKTKWTLTFSKTITSATGAVVKIGINQDYDNAWRGDAAFLEDKFVRFSYRFKFEDNEYSLMAPFTQPMFIPKQFSEFGAGGNTNTVDMDNAYKSTILNWFENNIENIVLKTPMPYSSPALNVSKLLITDIDLLYKESDALAVKVLDTVDVTSLPNQSTNFPSLPFKDPVNGTVSTYYYSYDYASSKPYKTLPQGQTTRVYDKVPIKALAQEVIGNRVVYGNYVDKHSGPDSIPFSALVDKKRPYNHNFVQYPYHNLKQNRTYQVGFVLSDRYGRQSDVILSSYDNVDGTQGSTIYSNYNTYTEQNADPIINWLGDTLQVKIDSAIGTQTGSSFPGQPGVWNATTNPLGWYSYKVVVKQQQQEYYNVYLPGFVNGLPIAGSEDENDTSFSVLLSDNINKVPRNLQEVGPTDTEYSSGELLYIRVNNPDINGRNNRPYGYPLKFTPWNKQYFPGFEDQEVLSIATVRDMEIQGIPFVSNAPQGDYGRVGTANTNPVGGTPSAATPVSIGSIPWGVSPVVQPFYNADLNPFAIKIDTTANGKVALNDIDVPTVPGGVGAITNANALGAANIQSMVPFLSVAETKPVYSLLEIFWETSLQGKLNTLNNLINSQEPGITALTSSSASFSESAGTNTKIGQSISFVTGGGTTIDNNALLTVSLESAFTQDNASSDVKSLFTLTYSGLDASYDLDTAGPTFWYGTGTASTPSNGIYNITIKVIYTPSGGVSYTSYMPYVATLQNVAPIFDDCSNPTGIESTTTTIKTFTAKNGSAYVANQTQQLTFDLDPSQANYSLINSQFNMSTNGVLTVNPSVLVDLSTYTVVARVRDANGAGLSTTCSITFTVGVQHVNRVICEGREGSTPTDCGKSLQTVFLASASTPTFSWPITVQSQANPNNNISFPQPNFNYNARASYTAAGTPTTGALTQGVMFLRPTLTSTLNPGSSLVEVYYTIQRRNLGGTTWSQAVDTSNNVINAIKLSASNGNPDSDTKNFSIPGEYRVVSTNISGEGCSAGSGTAAFFVDFGDATYSSGACTGPL